MSVRLGLLALLEQEPMHGYRLRQEFEARTGGTWPLNIGQVYTTIQRLIRDGLVVSASQGDADTDDAGAQTPDAVLAASGQPDTEQFELTDEGRAEIEAWWRTPVKRGTPARDELAIKLALAVTVPGVDVRAVVQCQRTETMRALRDFTRLKSRAEAGIEAKDLAWSLVLDHLIFAGEAEARWLDHVESRLDRAAVDEAQRAQERAVAKAEQEAADAAADAAGAPRPSKEFAPKKPSIRSILEKLESLR